MTKSQMIEIVKDYKARKVCNFWSLPKELTPYVETIYQKAFVIYRGNKKSYFDEDFYMLGYDILIAQLELENTKLHKALE